MSGVLGAVRGARRHQWPSWPLEFPRALTILAVSLVALLVSQSSSSQSLLREAPGNSYEERAEWVFREATRLPSRDVVRAELEALRNRWPQTRGGRSARLWLLEDAAVAGQWDQAAFFAAESPGFPDSSGTWSLLVSLSQDYATYSVADSISEMTWSTSPPSGPAPWSHLTVWILARRSLALHPEGDVLREYLALEGRAREEGWLGLWLAGLADVPQETPAWDAFLESWEREREAVAGSLEGNWIQHMLEGRGEEP